jgi:hypothetical protein
MHWRHGPPAQTVAHGAALQLTCHHAARRRVPAAAAPGGKLHVSAGGPAITHDVVLFVNLTQRWSFLSMNWGRWSLSAKR